MKKISLYSSKYCSDCAAMKEFLLENMVNYDNMDITEDLLSLKMFLKLRDNNPAFEEIKKNGGIGIPCLVINEGEKLFFDHENLNLDELK